MRKLLILGASGHARVIADATRATGAFTIVGLIDRDRPRGEQVDGMEVLGDDSLLPAIMASAPDLQLVIGIGDNGIRQKVANNVGPSRFATIVHPAAVLASDVDVGAGAFVAASATINCGARIGAHAVINTGACVDHDCIVGDFSFIAPGAVLAGGVRIGSGAFVGVGASVVPMVEIGDGAMIGAGAAVTRTVSPGVTVVGVPARPILAVRNHD